MTFGGETSRVISDSESQSADDAGNGGGGADKFLSKINPPTTPKTASSGPLKPCLLASGPESVAAEEDSAAKHKSAASAASASSASLSSVSSASSVAMDASATTSNHTQKIPKKFADLRAKNEKIRDAKLKEREESKAKYGNKFNELKAKNEERARKKEAEKAQQQRKEEDDGNSSDGCDWF